MLNENRFLGTFRGHSKRPISILAIDQNNDSGGIGRWFSIAFFKLASLVVQAPPISREHRQIGLTIFEETLEQDAEV
jgi:hypothetical protein